MTGRSESSPSVWRWRVLAALLILGIAGLRVGYWLTICPLDLAPDEAHYWDWSRHPDWSYYSKGPLVAFMIRSSCAVAGSWSQTWTGSEAMAVRLPAMLCGSLLLLSLYVLTVQVYGREGLALGVVALVATLPPITVGSSLMTIDAPYACCWGWALVLGYRALFRESRGAWVLLGLTIGVGIMAKYTMVLFIPSLFLFLLTSRHERWRLYRPGFWVMTLVAAACCVPILIWNAQSGWVSVRHVGGQAGLTEGGGTRWSGPLEYVIIQAALLLGFWFAGWVRAMYAEWPASDQAGGVRYLWWLSAPMFALFLAFSLTTHGEPNWPITAYLSGAVLMTAWLEQQLRSPHPGSRWAARGVIPVACALGLALSLIVHDTGPLRPLLAQLSGEPTEEHPLPLRRFDPTCRLLGWHAFAEAVDQIRADESVRGEEPVLAAMSWTVPGELGFYCAGHPTVYSVGLAVGDRHSQYDLWHPNPVADPTPFLGRTFIVVGEPNPNLVAGFDRVDPAVTITYSEGPYPLAAWKVCICRGFRGFSPHHLVTRATY